jgi:uncharacterized OB-fold protein
MMSHPIPFTIEQFDKFLSQKRIMAGKCKKCGKIHLPPRLLCDKCFNDQFTWQEISGKGRLITYTVIHIAPVQFQSQAPYAVGIIQLEEGLKLPGIIDGIPHEQLKIGMELKIVFAQCETDQSWPKWPRYYFQFK